MDGLKKNYQSEEEISKELKIVGIENFVEFFLTFLFIIITIYMVNSKFLALTIILLH